MRRRSLAVLTLSICVMVAALVGTGPANAAPRELPRLAITGDNFGTYGDHDYCRGALGTSLTSPKPRSTDEPSAGGVGVMGAA